MAFRGTNLTEISISHLWRGSGINATSDDASDGETHTTEGQEQSEPNMKQKHEHSAEKTGTTSEKTNASSSEENRTHKTEQSTSKENATKSEEQSEARPHPTSSPSPPPQPEASTTPSLSPHHLIPQFPFSMMLPLAHPMLQHHLMGMTPFTPGIAPLTPFSLAALQSQLAAAQHHYQQMQHHMLPKLTQQQHTEQMKQHKWSLEQHQQRVSAAAVATTTEGLHQAVKRSSTAQKSSQALQQMKKRARNSKESLDRCRQKHPLRPPCPAGCAKRCIRKIPEARRQELWSNYWQMDYNARRNYLYEHISRTSVVRTTIGMDYFGGTDAEPRKRRAATFYYSFEDVKGEAQNVCKVFFLTTLGYHKKNDAIVTCLMRQTPPGADSPPGDRRGKHPSYNKLDQELIMRHVESYNPAVSLYQRDEGTPNKRYLPANVSIKDMHRNFTSKYPDVKCCYQSYRAIMSGMNISLSKQSDEVYNNVYEAGTSVMMNDDDDASTDVDEDNVDEFSRDDETQCD